MKVNEMRNEILRRDEEIGPNTRWMSVPAGNYIVIIEPEIAFDKIFN